MTRHDGRELHLYFLLAFSLSLLLWTPVLGRAAHSRFFFSAGTFGPSLAAVLTHRIATGSWRAFRLFTPLPRFLLGTLGGAAAILLSAFTAAFFMTRSGAGRWQWAALIQILTLYAPNLLGGPLGEEPGWRGYALPRLQRLLPPVPAALLLGAAWAAWHLPLILSHVYNVTWWQFLAVTLSASVFLSFAFNLSGGSTLSAILLHGLYNIGTGIILNDFLSKADLYGNSVQHQVFWISYASVAAFLCVVTRGRLGLPRESGSARP